MQRLAFSLVELSIVLVILGLLTGGILAGQSLIHASELRSISADYTRYNTAVFAFRDRYFGLPGDLSNATSFWGAASNVSPSACRAAIGTGTQTCNGNGNGVVETYITSQYAEIFMFWQHLVNAGLIEGNYSGITGTGGNNNATAANLPPSKLSGAYWMVYNFGTTFSGSSTLFDGPYYENLLQFGGLTATSSNTNPILKPEDSWNIDTKLDDGRPATGVVRDRVWGTCTTAANSADANAGYKLTTTSAACLPLFYFR